MSSPHLPRKRVSGGGRDHNTGEPSVKEPRPDESVRRYERPPWTKFIIPNCVVCNQKARDPVALLCCESVYCHDCLLALMSNAKERNEPAKCTICENSLYKLTDVPERETAPIFPQLHDPSTAPPHQTVAPEEPPSCILCPYREFLVVLDCCSKTACRKCIVTRLTQDNTCPGCAKMFASNSTLPDICTMFQSTITEKELAIVPKASLPEIVANSEEKLYAVTDRNVTNMMPPLTLSSLAAVLNTVEDSTELINDYLEINRRLEDSPKNDLMLRLSSAKIDEEQFIKMNVLAKGAFVYMKNLRYTGKLGSGSYGIVFKTGYTQYSSVTDGKIVKHVIEQAAAKIWQKGINYREIYCLQFHHKNLVRYLTAIVQDDFLLTGFLMEIHETTLEDFVQRNKGSIGPYKFSWVVQLSDVVSFLHKKGIIVRDLKPSNIMLSGNGGHLVLIDLGLARLVNVDMTAFAGTFTFMAQEVCRDVSIVGYCPKADAFSFGLICHYIETEENPFGRHADICDVDRSTYLEKVLELSDRLHNAEPTSFISKIVVVTTAYDPKDRFTMKGINVIVQEANKKRMTSGEGSSSKP